MSNQFVDTESSGGTRDGSATRDYLGNDEGGGLQFTTPFDMRTVGQLRRQRTGTTTARLHRASTSLLAAGGRDDSIIDEPHPRHIIRATMPGVRRLLPPQR